MLQGFALEQPAPCPTPLGKTVPGFGFVADGQFIKVGSSEMSRKFVMLPFPGVTPKLAAVGFKFSPPPLNINVRIEGWIKIIPPPPRNTVFPVPKMSQATPNRGETLL